MAAINNRIAPEFLSTANKYGVNVQGVIEALWQPLYDVQTYAAAGQANLTFFQSPVGQNGKSYADTNGQAAGALPAQVNMLVTQIEIEALPGAATTALAYATDMLAMCSTGWMEFNIGNKNFLRESPAIGSFPPKHRLDVVASDAIAAAGPVIFRYAQNRGEIYNITPMLIQSNQNFNVTLNWQTVQSISTDATVRVKLNGYQFRTAQ